MKLLDLLIVSKYHLTFLLIYQRSIYIEKLNCREFASNNNTNTLSLYKLFMANRKPILQSAGINLKWNKCSAQRKISMNQEQQSTRRCSTVNWSDLSRTRWQNHLCGAPLQTFTTWATTTSVYSFNTIKSHTKCANSMNLNGRVYEIWIKCVSASTIIVFGIFRFINESMTFCPYIFAQDKSQWHSCK